MAQEDDVTAVDPASRSTNQSGTNVLNQIRPAEDPAYYSDEFKQMFEDHITYILTYAGKTLDSALYKVRLITTDDHQKLLRYSGDWFAFLTALGIRKCYHWPILRLNGLWDPFGLDTNRSSFLIPDYPFIDRLVRMCKEKRT